jgi:hypothetical protein
MYPTSKGDFYHDNINEVSFEFEGTGFILRGEAKKMKEDAPEHDFQAELYIDDIKAETAMLPTDFTTRRYELFGNMDCQTQNITYVSKCSIRRTKQVSVRGNISCTVISM